MLVNILSKIPALVNTMTVDSDGSVFRRHVFAEQRETRIRRRKMPQP
jgi:hypothetical protein